MPMDAREIERLIKARIPDAQVTIRDLAGDGDHYAATVISATFKGKSRVQQHQLGYEALKGQMGGVLHALALQTGYATSRSMGMGLRGAKRLMDDLQIESAAGKGTSITLKKWLKAKGM